MQRLFQDPLTHFLAAGLVLFLVFEAIGGGGAEVNPRSIVVDRDALLTFVQYRSRAFEPDIAAQRLDGMTDEELGKLIDDYLREEALYREAQALGLEGNDYIIRRRLVQKLEFIAQGFAEAASKVDDKALADYFADNSESYFVEPFLTFTHVFFDAEKQGRAAALQMAEGKLAELNARDARFSDAPKHGDRFPYHVNYVERTPDFVASHFGAPMARRLFALEASDTKWRGPFESVYGYHLVMLTRNQPGRYPALEEVAERARQDAVQALVRERTEASIAEIVKTYEVRIELQLPTGREGEEALPAG